MIRLEQYLKEYRALTIGPPLHERLAAFLQKARPILRAEAIDRHDKPKPVPEPDAENLARILPNLADLMKQARGRGDGLNAWAAAGLRYVEVRNAGVLAALWDTRRCGDQGVNFLHKFLSRIPPRETILPTREQLGEGYWVRTEHCPLPGKQSERIDLTIEGQDFILIIEIKINAGEGNNQFERYGRTADDWQRLRGKQTSIILLERYTRPNFQYFHATWSDVASAAKILLREQKNDNFHKNLLSNFVHHISKF